MIYNSHKQELSNIFNKNILIQNLLLKNIKDMSCEVYIGRRKNEYIPIEGLNKDI